MTDPKPTSPVASQRTSPEIVSETDQVRAKKFQRMVNLVNRVRIVPGGERLFLRFNQLEILEHWILSVNFGVLAVTGLLEMFAHNRISAGIIMVVFNNIDKVRGIHNLAALFFAGVILAHMFRVVVKWFIKNDPPILMPTGQDLRDIGRMWKYILGRNTPRPEYGRFTIDQKLTYWTVAAFSAVLLFTAGIQWFQIGVAQLMPEAVLPMARSLHSLTGFLAVVTLVPWHIYHTVLKEWNLSIFTGLMDEKTIRRKHLLDYRQIMTAIDAYQNLTNRIPTGEDQPAVKVLHSHEEQPLSQGIFEHKTEAKELLIELVDKDNGTQS